MAAPLSDNHSNTVKDVEQLGIWAGIASLSYVFWICGGMEMIERFSRELLTERGVNQTTVDGIPNGEAFTYLVENSAETSAQLTEILYQSHNIGQLWYIMAAVGVLSAFGLYVYGRWTYQQATA